MNRSQIRGAGAYSALLLCRRSQKRKETVDRVQKDLKEKKKPPWIEKGKYYLKEREGVQKDFIQWVVSKKDLDLEDKK